ncbi:hypothetical protein Bbelb_123390 [Branchiostoma belcheri]|nr:hypothetical protein Bbelb_123390 [Branchiostoma belcheri]
MVPLIPHYFWVFPSNFALDLSPLKDRQPHLSRPRSQRPSVNNFHYITSWQFVRPTGDDDPAGESVPGLHIRRRRARLSSRPPPRTVATAATSATPRYPELDFAHEPSHLDEKRVEERWQSHSLISGEGIDTRPGEDVRMERINDFPLVRHWLPQDDNVKRLHHTMGRF